MSENASVQFDSQDGMNNTGRSEGNMGQSEQMNRENGQGQKSRSARGFASMDRQRQKEIASEGGRAAHQQGVAHEWTREEAREAGRKGGQSVSQNREHMSEIGRRGGQRSGGRRRQQNNESNRGNE